MQPETNQRSSATTARKKTRFVVNRGRINVGSVDAPSELGFDSEKRNWRGANSEYVPVPVLASYQPMSSLETQHKFRAPIWSMFTVVEDVPNQVQILVLFMYNV